MKFDMKYTVVSLKTNNALALSEDKPRCPHNFLPTFLSIRHQDIFLLLQPTLSKLGPASLFVSTEHPRIAQARPVVTAAHSFTRLATFTRRLKLEIRPPLHRRSPQLQISHSTATPAAVYTGMISRVREPDGRIECVILGTGTENIKEDGVDGKTRDQTDEEESGGGETTTNAVV